MIALQRVVAQHQSRTSMRGARWIVAAVSGLGMLLLAGFSPLHMQPEQPAWQPAKLGFSYLSQAQMQDLWKRADNYAMAIQFWEGAGAMHDLIVPMAGALHKATAAEIAVFGPTFDRTTTATSSLRLKKTSAVN